MMSVLEYAEDVNKTVSEILSLCKKLNISVSDEEDMLDEDAITLLDNSIDEIIEEEELEDLEYEDELILKGYIKEPRRRVSALSHKYKCLIVPTLAHGLYDFLCTMGTDASLVMLMAFVIFMYVHCFRKIIRI